MVVVRKRAKSSEPAFFELVADGSPVLIKDRIDGEDYTAWLVFKTADEAGLYASLYRMDAAVRRVHNRMAAIKRAMKKGAQIAVFPERFGKNGSLKMGKIRLES